MKYKFMLTLGQFQYWHSFIKKLKEYPAGTEYNPDVSYFSPTLSAPSNDLLSHAVHLGFINDYGNSFKFYNEGKFAKQEVERCFGDNVFEVIFNGNSNFHEYLPSVEFSTNDITMDDMLPLLEAWVEKAYTDRLEHFAKHTLPVSKPEDTKRKMREGRVIITYKTGTTHNLSSVDSAKDFIANNPELISDIHFIEKIVYTPVTTYVESKERIYL